MRSRWLGLLALLASGCSEELGPEQLATAEVKGKVQLAGRPVTSGWVEFWPVQGTRGNSRTAPLRADGSFEARGVAVGLNRLVLAHAPLDQIFTPMGPVPGHVFTNLATSPIERRIEAVGNTINLDLGPIAFEYVQKKRRGGS